MNASVDEADAAIGGGGDIGAVGDKDHGGFFPAGEGGEQFDHSSAGSRIEIPGGLVSKEYGRAMDEGAGEGGALHLAAGELMGSVKAPVG